MAVEPTFCSKGGSVTWVGWERECTKGWKINEAQFCNKANETQWGYERFCTSSWRVDGVFCMDSGGRVEHRDKCIPNYDEQITLKTFCARADTDQYDIYCSNNLYIPLLYIHLLLCSFLN